MKRIFLLSIIFISCSETDSQQKENRTITAGSASSFYVKEYLQKQLISSANLEISPFSVKEIDPNQHTYMVDGIMTYHDGALVSIGYTCNLQDNTPYEEASTFVLKSLYINGQKVR